METAIVYYGYILGLYTDNGKENVNICKRLFEGNLQLITSYMLVKHGAIMDLDTGRKVPFSWEGSADGV